MDLLYYSTHRFGLCPTLLVVIVVSPLCCSCSHHHVGSHSSSCFPTLFLLPPRIGLGCTCPPCIGLGGNPPPLPLCVWPNPPPLPLHVGLGSIHRHQPPFVVPCLSPLWLTFLTLAITVCVPVNHWGWGGCCFIGGGVAVIVATFTNSPAFAYIAVGHYLSFLGPLILHGGCPVTGVGFDLLALVFIGGIHHPPPHSLAPPPPCHLAGPPAHLAPFLLFLLLVSPLLLLLALPCHLTPPPSHLCSLLIFLPPQILCWARLNCPHPFGKGRGSWGYILTSEGELRPYWRSPHPSMEERGL